MEKVHIGWQAGTYAVLQKIAYNFKARPMINQSQQQKKHHRGTVNQVHKFLNRAFSLQEFQTFVVYTPLYTCCMIPEEHIYHKEELTGNFVMIVFLNQFQTNKLPAQNTFLADWRRVTLMPACPPEQVSSEEKKNSNKNQTHQQTTGEVL